MENTPQRAANGVMEDLIKLAFAARYEPTQWDALWGHPVFKERFPTLWNEVLRIMDPLSDDDSTQDLRVELEHVLRSIVDVAAERVAVPDMEAHGIAVTEGIFMEVDHGVARRLLELPLPPSDEAAR